MQLYNTLSAEERAALIEESGKQRLTLSFYAYANIEDPQAFRDSLFVTWNKLEVLGRIYVAKEGINAQLSLPADNFYAFKDHLDTIPFLKDIRLNVAVEQDDLSFLKLTIKVRNKIVADGLDDATFDVTNKGVHLGANDFNKMLEDPNTIVVDFRNHYESEVGHFKGAITPDVETFRESLPIIEEQLQDYKEDKNLLMYCTGGIRCEKASAFFRHKGFKNVYQLEGGIIEYTRQVKEENLESKFIGKNFVFDGRLGERITDDIISQCHQCGKPCDNHTNCANEACHLLFIQCDDCKASMHNTCSAECLEVIQLPEEEQKALRRGVNKGNMIFRKGKSDKLTYKHSGVLSDTPIATATKPVRARIRKTLIGKGEHYYPKAGVGQFTIEQGELKAGDKIIISGPTTGEQQLTVENMRVNGNEGAVATAGDKVTFNLPFRVRLSDKLYRVL
ncbi:rhodanese-related sulfurtransferase [Flavobacterium sp. RHBU_3]|uniref:oxygen-dependent tRNA uridine(34) hydroxylase TrhO n=1 Tax=Flavobacterium sp. RHBU_3 TaxID=3391184 RepID=UPI0039851CF5